MPLISSSGNVPRRTFSRTSSPGLSLQLLRSLLGLALQVFDLPPHVGELALFLGVFEAVLFDQTRLRFGDEPGPLLVNLSRDRQFEVLVAPFQFALAFSQRQLGPACRVELSRLIPDLVLESSQFLKRLLFRLPRCFLAGTLQLLAELPVVVFSD